MRKESQSARGLEGQQGAPPAQAALYWAAMSVLLVIGILSGGAALRFGSVASPRVATAVKPSKAQPLPAIGDTDG